MKENLPINEQQRSRIKENIGFDYMEFKCREGTGTGINDTGDLGLTNPGTSVLTAAKTVAGTTATMWATPSKGINHATAQDLFAGFNADAAPDVTDFLDLTAFNGYFVVALRLENSAAPTAADEWPISIGGTTNGKNGVAAFRYATNGIIYFYVAGRNAAADTSISAANAQGKGIGAAPGNHFLMGVIDCTDGWSSLTPITIFTDGVIASAGWIGIGATAAAEVAPKPLAMVLFGSPIGQVATTGFKTELDAGGIDYTKDIFVGKLPNTLSQSDVEAIAADWADHESEFPFGFTS